DLAAAEPLEDYGSALEQLLTRGGVVDQADPRVVQGAAFHESPAVDRTHRPARLAVRHQPAARSQARQTAFERVVPHAVVHDVHATAAGQPAGFGGEVLLGVENGLVGARLARD